MKKITEFSHQHTVEENQLEKLINVFVSSFNWFTLKLLICFCEKSFRFRKATEMFALRLIDRETGAIRNIIDSALYKSEQCNDLIIRNTCQRILVFVQSRLAFLPTTPAAKEKYSLFGS